MEMLTTIIQIFLSDRPNQNEKVRNVGAVKVTNDFESWNWETWKSEMDKIDASDYKISNKTTAWAQSSQRVFYAASAQYRDNDISHYRHFRTILQQFRGLMDHNARHNRFLSLREA